MHLSFYSCLMAMFSSSTMIIAVHFLKKTKYFANAFSVTYMGMLYILSLVRMLFPVEIPAIQMVFRDKLFLPKLMDVLENRSYLTSHLEYKLIYMLGAVFALVTVVLLVIFLYKQIRFINKVLKMPNYATEKEQKLLRTIGNKVFKRRTMMRLIKSDSVSVPMVVGMVKSTIIIPNNNYTEEELKLILYHECTHLKNHDLWLKFLVHIYCCVFWYNPLAYLLKSDMDFILELKCDNAVCRRLDDMSKLNYAKLINDSARRQIKKRLPIAVMSAEFATMNSTERHSYRMNNLLNPANKRPIVPIAIVSSLMVCICLLSYVFICVPDYSHDTENVAQVSFTEEQEEIEDKNTVAINDIEQIFYCEQSQDVVIRDESPNNDYEDYTVLEDNIAD